MSESFVCAFCKETHALESIPSARVERNKAFRQMLGTLVGVFAGGGLLSPAQIERVSKADPGWRPIPYEKAAG